MSKVYTITTTWPHGWDASAQMSVDVLIDRHSTIERSSHSTPGGTSILTIVDQGDDKSGVSYTLAEIAEQLGLCGTLTECHLLVSALRQYAVIREACGLGDSTNDHDWEPYTAEQLDGADAKDYDLLCRTVGIVYGSEAEAAQREALSKVLTGGAHSVLIYGQQCSMSGRRAPDSYRNDDGTVSDDVVEYRGTMDKLRETAAELERVGNERRNAWMSSAARVLREYIEAYP